MHWLPLVILIFQIVSCRSQITNSALSCILGTYEQSSLKIIKKSSKFSNEVTNKTIEENIEFRLYTHEHSTGTKITINDEESLKNSNFSANRPTRIITHGFNGNGQHAACIDPAKAFLEKGNFNVIIMDWYNHQAEGSWFLLYWKVIKKLKEVGIYLAEMINFLEKYGMNLNTTTLIGHSLGAHVVGIAGYHTKNKVNHIIGLDPAEPFLKNREPGERISKEDAIHVEIIHTNGNHCGMFKRLGHYDFYPNGGITQPGCTIMNLCSHKRAYIYYTESIRNPSSFYGKRCPDPNNINKENCDGEIAKMGGLSRSSILPGVYYVEVKEY